MVTKVTERVATKGTKSTKTIFIGRRPRLRSLLLGEYRRRGRRGVSVRCGIAGFFVISRCLRESVDEFAHAACLPFRIAVAVLTDATNNVRTKHAIAFKLRLDEELIGDRLLRKIAICAPVVDDVVRFSLG